MRRDMEPIWILLPDWMVNKVSFPGCSPVIGWRRRKRGEHGVQGYQKLPLENERFSKLKRITWRDSGWQTSRKSRAGRRYWEVRRRGDMLDSIKSFINGSFLLLHWGQNLNGYKSTWHWQGLWNPPDYPKRNYSTLQQLMKDNSPTNTEIGG